MNNDNMNRLPHMNPNNYDQYAPPISKEPVVFSDQWKNENLVMSKFTPYPYDLNQNQNELQKENFSDKERSYLQMSYAMNPFGFVQPELFRSSNMSLTDSPHPIACVLVGCFKGFILLLFFSYPYFGDNHVLLFELIILLSLFDFWVVKNVCGRILVGLKWWVDNEGEKEQWVFETRVHKVTTTAGRVHYRIFWFTQLFLSFMFIGLFLANLFTWQIDLSICMFCPAVQTACNLWAFNMCNKVKRSKMGNYLMQMSFDKNLQSVRLPLKLD